MKYTSQTILSRPSLSLNSAYSVSALFHLSHLLEAGVSLSDALADVRELESSHGMRRVWADIKSQVDAGRAFSEAMATWPRVFKATSCALIQAGEANGTLVQACKNCMAELQWQADIRQRLYSALLYPALALVILLAVVLFLFVYVVPSMHGFLLVNQFELAWHTQALLIVSTWLAQHGPDLLLLICAVIACLSLLRMLSPTWRLFLDRRLLAFPLIGRTLVELSLSRYASTCAHLYDSGVALNEAIRIGEAVVENRALHRVLEQTRLRMVAGSSFARSMDVCEWVSPAFKRIVAAGESSGALTAAMHYASSQQKHQADCRIERIETLAGPLLLLLVGSSLLWIVVSVLGPVYSVAINAVISS